MENRTAISASSLSIGYRIGGGKSKVVHTALSVDLYCGQLTCLLGLNGAGKSTLLRTLCGFQPPLSGDVKLFGKPFESYSRSRLSTVIGVVLTEKTNAGGITVRELVTLGRYPHTGFLARLGDRDRMVVQRAIDDVGISSKADCRLGELSDGERQKAFIAKALAQECPVIMLDEPTAFLDVISRMEVMVLLRRLAREQDKAILLSTHDLDSALQNSDRIWLMGRDTGAGADRGGDAGAGNGGGAGAGRATGAGAGRATDAGADWTGGCEGGGYRSGGMVNGIICGKPDEMMRDGTLERFFNRGAVRFDSDTGRLVTDSFRG